jgi:hypothetical protein
MKDMTAEMRLARRGEQWAMEELPLMQELDQKVRWMLMAARLTSLNVDDVETERATLLSLMFRCLDDSRDLMGRLCESASRLQAEKPMGS